jgi:hypothetical protein
MPLPADHSLAAAQYLIEDATGARFYACNCPNQQPTRTLRFVQSNRAYFSLPNEAKPRAADKEPT